MSTDLDKARAAAAQDRGPDAYVVRLRDLRVALAEVDRLTADLAALRIEHAAWGAIIDVTRKDRDALRARVAELERAVDAARKAERADALAYAAHIGDVYRGKHGGGGDYCRALGEFLGDVQAGAHEGAAGGS